MWYGIMFLNHIVKVKIQYLCVNEMIDNPGQTGGKVSKTR